MESRPYFLLGDIFSNGVLGALAGTSCAALVGESWKMLPAMLVGMLLGMALAAPLQFVCGIFFGAFEVMLPMMLTGMMTGMVIAMVAATRELPWDRGALWGAGLGVAVLAFTYLANAFLEGEVRQERS